MSCLTHLLLYLLLLPITAASPFFVLLYFVAVVTIVFPCVQCMVVGLILYFATSASSPFLSQSELPSLAAFPILGDAQLALSVIIPNRTLTSTLGGRLFDPALVGYREMAMYGRHDSTSNETVVVVEGHDNKQPARAVRGGLIGKALGRIRSFVDSSRYMPEEAESVEDTPPSEASVSATSLPKNYWDLRVFDFGFVVDLNWRRTEEGLRFEVADYKRAFDLQRAEKEEYDAEHRRTVEDKPVKEEQGSAASSAKSGEAERKQHWWSTWSPLSRSW